MEEDACIRILVELIYTQSTRDTEEIIARNPSIPKYFLTEDFSYKMSNILLWRKTIIPKRWSLFFDECYKKMLSSHEMYLTFVMFACKSEKNSLPSIFDNFISVCVLVFFLNQETFKKTSVDFRSLSADIAMVFYQNELKFLFSQQGGFQQMLEHIRSHRLTRTKCSKNPHSLKGSTDPNSTRRIVTKKIKRELNKVIVKISNPEEVATDQKSIDLANFVLLLPSIELPTLPSYDDLIKRLVEYRKNITPTKTSEKEKTKNAVKIEALNADLQMCSSSVANSKKIKLNTNYHHLRKHNRYAELKPAKNMVELSENHLEFQEIPDVRKAVLEMDALSYQHELSTTSVQPVNLLNTSDQIERLNAFKKREIPKPYGKERRVKAALTSETSNVTSSSSVVFTTNFDPKNEENMETCCFKDALSHQQRKVPNRSNDPYILPNKTDKIGRPGDSKKREISRKNGKEARLKAAAPTNVTSTSDSKTNYNPKNQDNILQYEDIIQAVIKYNHAKSSINENTKNRIHEEPDGLLEKLNNTIKSFIEVLDK